MKPSPIRIRTFILGTVLVLLVLPVVAGGSAWLLERHRQHAAIEHRVNTAAAYLTSHRARLREPATVYGFARLLARLDLLGQVVVVSSSPPGKDQIYVSPTLEKAPTLPKARLARERGAPAASPTEPDGFQDDRRLIAIGTRKQPASLIVDLYHRTPARAPGALAALVAGVIVLLAGLAGALWLAGRWMVSPLTTLSAQVDKVAGGDLEIVVPASRVGEITNIAQAVEGMTSALGESAERQAEADEARRFLVTGVAHDLRTPLFALRGHLQAIRAGVGDPALHLERAEARADALERLIGNLFTFTRDDYAQPVPQLEAVPIAELLDEVATGLEHTAHLRKASLELVGDDTIQVVADRDRLKRALTNVLDNALRYSPSGAPIHISWADTDESTVELSIRDHGPGVDPDLLPHIFEPGIRGPAERGDPEAGSGLGLAIATRLLEHQGATITVSNGNGATFRITLRQEHELR